MGKTGDDRHRRLQARCLFFLRRKILAAGEGKGPQDLLSGGGQT